MGIAKAVNNAESSIENASYKLQIANLMIALASSKANVAEIKSIGCK